MITFYLFILRYLSGLEGIQPRNLEEKLGIRQRKKKISNERVLSQNQNNVCILLHEYFIFFIVCLDENANIIFVRN